MAERLMKDSRIEWIGEIPKSWEVNTIGSLYSERKEKCSDTEYPPLSVTMQGVVTQLSTAAKTDAHDDRKLVRKGDFAINSRSDRRGSCGIAPQDGSVSLINTILKPKKNMNPDYYNWLFHSDMFSSEFYKWGHGIVDDLWTTNWQDMKAISVPVPTLEEQALIADFLDKKVSEIDAVISKTKVSIEEYIKLKQSIIFEVVTKGLDSSVEMKDSGIEWIGKIPSNWFLNTVFQIFVQVKNKNTGSIENNLLSLSYGKIKRKDIQTTEGLLPESFDGYNIIEVNDIVLRLTDLQNDHKSLRVGIAEEKGIVTSAYITLRNRSLSVPKYLYYYLYSFDIAKGFYGMGAGVRQGLTWDGIKWLKTLIPTYEEQKSIVNYLDEMCARFEKLISKKEQFITELEQYKKSLIYEYVTGKKEVA